MRISPRRGLVGVLAVLLTAVFLTVAALIFIYLSLVLAGIDPAALGLGDTGTIIFSVLVVLILLVAVVLLPIRFILDVIKRFTAEVALTDRRLFGRGGVQPWSRFDWPIEQLVSVRYSWPLQSQLQFLNRKGRTARVLAFHHAREFAQVVERALIVRDGVPAEQQAVERLKPA